MDESRIKELDESRNFKLSDDFSTCLSKGIIDTVKTSTDKIVGPDKHMSASIIVHHWNHAKFLPMLFESFYHMDKDNIDTEFIITDSGSDKTNKEKIYKLIEYYRDKLKIKYLYHDLSDIRDKFNTNNPDGTFHGFPYISNSALNFVNNTVHIICDSSNIVDNQWLRGLCSPHYIWPKSKIIVKSRGGDFTPESTITLEDKSFNYDYFNLHHTYYKFAAGTGFGWSILTDNIKLLGGFNQLLSCCGAVDDDFIYRARKYGFMYIGQEKSFAIHRIHSEGYEKNKRKPNWGYKQLVNLHVNNKTSNIIKNDIIAPIKVVSNHD